VNVSIFNLSSSSLIKILGSDVATSSSSDIHLRLISVATVRTLPDKLTRLIFYDHDLTIPAALLTVVRLDIEFSIHNVIVDILDYSKSCFDVIIEISTFYITNCTARGKSLELTFYSKFLERIYFFCYMNMIAVSYIVLICNSRDFASALL
jgi:hypothetical protein